MGTTPSSSTPIPPATSSCWDPKIGRHTNGDVAKPIGVPGASKAVLETFSHANTGRYAKDLLAVYPQGVVQVSVNYSTLLSDKTMVAVVRLLTHT